MFLATVLTQAEKERSDLLGRVERFYLFDALAVTTHLSHVLLQQARRDAGSGSAAAAASSSLSAARRASRASLAIVRELSRLHYCSLSFDNFELATAARAKGYQ